MRVYQFRHVGTDYCNCVYYLYCDYIHYFVLLAENNPVVGAHGGTRTPTPEGTWT